MILVSVKELRSTDVLAVDVYGPKKQLLCAKGVTLTPEVARRLVRCGLESVHIQDRDGSRPEMSNAQRQQIQEIIDARFQHVSGDDFMRHLKLIVGQTLIVPGEEEEEEGEEDGADSPDAPNQDASPEMASPEMASPEMVSPEIASNDGGDPEAQIDGVAPEVETDPEGSQPV